MPDTLQLHQTPSPTQRPAQKAAKATTAQDLEGMVGSTPRLTPCSRSLQIYGCLGRAGGLPQENWGKGHQTSKLLLTPEAGKELARNPGHLEPGLTQTQQSPSTPPWTEGSHPRSGDPTPPRIPAATTAPGQCGLTSEVQRAINKQNQPLM